MLGYTKNVQPNLPNYATLAGYAKNPNPPHI